LNVPSETVTGIEIKTKTFRSVKSLMDLRIDVNNNEEEIHDSSDLEFEMIDPENETEGAETKDGDFILVEEEPETDSPMYKDGKSDNEGIAISDNPR
jgi:hypothetical protein